MRMFIPLLCCVAASLTGIATEAAAVHRVEYKGQLIQIGVDGGDVPVRGFAVVAWMEDSSESARMVYRVDDEGRRGLEWWERVGRIGLNAEIKPDGPLPRLRHVHLGRSYTLRLPSPAPSIPPSPAVGNSWIGEWGGRRIEWVITGEQRRGNHECWETMGQADPARRQKLLIDKETGLLVTAGLRVFMGQGDRFKLELELERETVLSEDEAQLDRQIAEAILQLQEQLDIDADVTAGELSSLQIATVETALPTLKQLSAGSSWAQFVESMSADVAADRRRVESIAVLAERRLGKLAPEFTLTALDGSAIDLTASAGKPIVLHFWEYRGSPESPFGQVGYLDFLANKLKGDGVQVIGVAVDERLADPAQLARVRREVQKFTREFIRVSYPLAVDDGTILEQFGDPRPLEAPLPLWVVIAPDGTVVHFRSGLYTIDPNRGLEELSEIVRNLSR